MNNKSREFCKKVKNYLNTNIEISNPTFSESSFNNLND